MPNPIPAYCPLVLLLIACPDPEIQEAPIDECVPFGDDEVGECGEIDEDDDVGKLAPDECMYYENPNETGYRIQCEGEFHTQLDFHIGKMNCEEAIDEEFCSKVYPFGPPFDTYEAPDVMACCGETWDPVEHLDVYQDACMRDLAAQACASMAIRLAQAIEAGDFETKFGDFTDKATNLQAYIANHFVDCAATLYNEDADPDPGELESSWSIPNMAGPYGWWPAVDIVISVEAGTAVVDVHRPEKQKDWLECHGAFDNNDEIFEGRTGSTETLALEQARGWR
jgi:hypothetical protein